MVCITTVQSLKYNFCGLRMLFSRNRYFVGRYVTTVSVLASLKVLSDGGGGGEIETQKLKAPMAFIHVCHLFLFKSSVTCII